MPNTRKIRTNEKHNLRSYRNSFMENVIQPNIYICIHSEKVKDKIDKVKAAHYGSILKQYRYHSEKLAFI